ncbi:peptidase family s41 domain-containing protein [Ditylenchus destructor]|nr:peptidase family s41 domain-containing protein [Ditylenchus destructor]
MSLSLEGIGAVLQSDNDRSRSCAWCRQVRRTRPSRSLRPTRSSVLPRATKRWSTWSAGAWTKCDSAHQCAKRPDRKIVSITREAVKLEDQAVQKKVLNLKQDGKDYKLGVIEIPAFYLDFKAFRAGDPDYKSTTRDVKKILTELQKEKVDGVVIDLRNNGGGSLDEAIELTGLFIDKGPTVLVRNADGRVDVLEDENPGAFYKGPMAFAGQPPVGLGLGDLRWRHPGLSPRDDHRRPDLRKGTVQTIQPLNHGELKLTLAKFYRVSGQSTQHQGVLPDIDFPSIIDTRNRRERSAGSHAMGHHPPCDQAGL